MSRDKAGTNTIQTETRKLKRELTLLPLFGLTLITVLMTSIVGLAIVSNYLDVGMTSISWALFAMLAGAVLYFPIRKWTKPGVPDVDPYITPEEAD